MALAAAFLLSATASAAAAAEAPKLVAETYNSGFADAHDTFNGMGAASDGKIYYVLCSQKHDVAAQMYAFDPATRNISHLGDLTEACGEKAMKAVAQGKSHVNFVETRGKLYFATHIGIYKLVDELETIGPPPPGWKPYQGGHFLAYDMATGTFQDLAVAPRGEGIITMTMDTRRGRLYGLTWPSGHFLRFDLAAKELRDLGPACLGGESGKGSQYRKICRALVVDSDQGGVYFTSGEGTIKRYRYDRDAIETVAGEDMKKDYFGRYDPASSEHMAYNWRQALWHPAEQVIYGVHGPSGYLFRFDPRAERLELLERLTSLASKRSGMYDQFSYGHLGLALGPDRRTLYYLTGGPIYVNGKRLATASKGEVKGLEDLHLLTYDIPTAAYRDHGAVFYKDGQRPLYVNSIAVGRDGAVYSLARVTEHGHTRTDLIRIQLPATQRQ
jgi:hypothetical protein